MPDTAAHPLRDTALKFWAPVPWLLEASIVLELVLHKYFEASVIAAALIASPTTSSWQRRKGLWSNFCPANRLA